MIFENVTKKFGEHTVLESFSMQINEKEKVALFGANGSGKTTIFNIVAGLENIDAGRVYGYSLEDVAYLFQEDVFFENISLIENLVLLSPLKREDAIALSEQYLRELSLYDYRNSLPKTLSGGMRKRAALACVFASGRRIILLDECSNALDENMKDSVIRFIKAHSKDKTIIAISHDRNFAMQFCDRYIEI